MHLNKPNNVTSKTVVWYAGIKDTGLNWRVGGRGGPQVWPQLPREVFVPPRVLTALRLRNSGRGTVHPRVKHESSYRLSSVNTVKESITNSNRPEVLLEWLNVSICFPGFWSRIAKKGMFIFFSSPQYTCTICHLQCVAYWFFPPQPPPSVRL